MVPRLVIGTLSCLLLLGPPGVAAPMETSEPLDGYVPSDNVEFLGSVELLGSSGGARKMGSRLYATSEGGLQIFDVSEVGYFMPIGGSTSDVDWISGDIVYATDYNARGLDILRLKS